MSNAQPYPDRIAAVRNKLAEWDVAGVYITNPTNRRWLSGFTGSAGELLITAESAFLATDFRYWELAIKQAPMFTLFRRQRNKAGGKTADLLAQAGVTEIGFEAEYVTVAKLETLEEEEGIAWRPLSETASAS